MYDLFGLILLFIVSLAVLLKSSDVFTDAAEKIGLSLGLPSFIVGVTIVSIGTSMPEIISSIFAVLEDSPEIVAGNVVGSNIANIFLVVAAAAIIGRKLTVTYEIVHVGLPFLVGTAFLLAAGCWDGVYTLFEALVSLSALALYLSYTVRIQKDIAAHEEDEEKRGKSLLRRLL